MNSQAGQNKKGEKLELAKQNLNRSRADEPAVMEYRAAAIEARKADARFAAAEARVASTVASVEDDYKISSRVASAKARDAVVAAKDDTQVNGLVNDKGEAEQEYNSAMLAKKEADKRVKLAEEALKEDLELAALAYTLAEEDSIEKEIAMTLLEEGEIKIVAQKYNVDDTYARIKYKKEKKEVQLAEEEFHEAEDSKNAAEIEAEELKKKAEKLANYIAEYNEFQEVGLTDHSYKKVTSEVQDELKEATINSIEAEKIAEELKVKASKEEEELLDIISNSEIYKEVQERIRGPLHDAEEASKEGKSLPKDYERNLSEAAQEESIKVQVKKLIEDKKKVWKNKIFKRKQWSLVKIIFGVSFSLSSSYFAFLNPNYYLSFAVPCFIAGLSMIGFGVREWEEASDEVFNEGDVYNDQFLNQSLAKSLSSSLLQSISQKRSGNNKA